MDSRMMLRILLWCVILWTAGAQIRHMGRLNTSQSIKLGFNSTDPFEWLEYEFSTNYKKVLFELTTTPSEDPMYKQRIILSDMPYHYCPQRCSEEPNYCTAITNRISAKTEAMFSKWFPTLFVYIVNQHPMPHNMMLSDDSEGNLELDTTIFSDALAETTPGFPIFDLKPSHLESGWKIVHSIVPQCAGLSLRDCIDPAFCTTDCSLLTCQNNDGGDLFSLCTASDITNETLFDVCSAHSQFQQNYTMRTCRNPTEYNPSLSQTSAGLLMLWLVVLGTVIFSTCCYALRLGKNSEATSMFCPS